MIPPLLTETEYQDIQRICNREWFPSKCSWVSYQDYLQKLDFKKKDEIVLYPRATKFTRIKIKEYRNLFLYLDHQGKISLKRKAEVLCK